MHAHDLDHSKPLPLAPYLPVSGAVAIVVEAAPDGGWWLDDGAARRLARRAASCPLAPQVRDRVWVVGETDLYIIAVLERAEPLAPATLAFEGDVAVTAGGRMTLAARQGIDLVTPAGLGVNADELHVQARSGRAVLQELRAHVRSMFSSLTRVTHVGEVLELLVDRVTQRSKHSMRAIDGLDHTRAQTIDYRAGGSAHIQAKHALVNGKELVKLDGGQIHLG